MTDKEKLEKIKKYIENQKEKAQKLITLIDNEKDELTLFNEGVYSQLSYLESYIDSLNDSALKECPFCGGEAKLNTELAGFKPSEYIIYCTDCGTSSRYYKSQEEAVSNWNKRK